MPPPEESTRGNSSVLENDWPAWMAPAALLGALALATICALIIDIPAAAFGVKITSSNLPGGLEIADTVVQEVVFVVTVLLFAQMGARKVRAAQLGLRRGAMPWFWIGALVVGTQLCFLLFNVLWATVLDVNTKEKVLEQLGANEGTGLLLLSAALTCVLAPICEEILFRGFIFSALRKWKGTWPAALLTGIAFGGAHAGSAPLIDLVPLAALGVGLCVLYRLTRSLYPCMATHALNNSIAFGALEHWRWWQVMILIAVSLATIRALALLLYRLGITREPTEPTEPPSAGLVGSHQAPTIAPAS